MKELLEALGNSLESSDTPGDFDGNDLVNALLILQHVAFSIGWKYQRDVGFTFAQQEVMAVEFGKNMRQSIHLFTGIDTADIVRGDNWAEVING